MTLYQELLEIQDDQDLSPASPSPLEVLLAPVDYFLLKAPTSKYLNLDNTKVSPKEEYE